VKFNNILLQSDIS